MAEMIPFPLARRVEFVRRHASRALELKPDAGERHIQRMVDDQRATLLRKGCSPERVEAECSALEGAIRAKSWHMVMTGGGAA